MPIDLTTASGVQVQPFDTQLLVSWVSSLPAAGTFQVYVDRNLSWWGRTTRAVVPRPMRAGPVRVDVGSVAPADARTDFSSSLPPDGGTGNRVELSWVGSLAEGVDLAGWRVYGSLVPGGPVSYAAPLATIAAFPTGVPADGFGVGGFGAGGFGSSAIAQSWTSGPLRGGVWQFAVTAVDVAGNESRPGRVASAVVVAPPGPPAKFGDGRRLHLQYVPPSVGLGAGGFGQDGYGTGGTVVERGRYAILTWQPPAPDGS